MCLRPKTLEWRREEKKTSEAAEVGFASRLKIFFSSRCFYWKQIETFPDVDAEVCLQTFFRQSSSSSAFFYINYDEVFHVKAG